MKYLFLFLLFLSCNSQENNKIVEIKKNIELIDRVKDSIIMTESIISGHIISAETLNEKISKEDYQKLSEMNFKSVSFFKNNIIALKFENAVNEYNEKEPTLYSYYLFYGTEIKKREEVIYYEQFSECRSKLDQIGKNWTFVALKTPCAD